MTFASGAAVSGVGAGAGASGGTALPLPVPASAGGALGCAAASADTTSSAIAANFKIGKAEPLAATRVPERVGEIADNARIYCTDLRQVSGRLAENENRPAVKPTCVTLTATTYSKSWPWPSWPPPPPPAASFFGFSAISVSVVSVRHGFVVVFWCVVRLFLD